MPIREFRCKKCGNVFELIFFRSEEKDAVLCPSCGHAEVEPIISTFSLSGSVSGKGGGGSPLSSSCPSSGGFS